MLVILIIWLDNRLFVGSVLKLNVLDFVAASICILHDVLAVCSWSLCWNWQLLWPNWNTWFSSLSWTQSVKLTLLCISCCTAYCITIIVCPVSVWLETRILQEDSAQFQCNLAHFLVLLSSCTKCKILHLTPRFL